MTVTAKKVGGSVAVLIPKAVAREMQLVAGTPLDITTADGAIVMRRARVRPERRRRRPIGEIVAGIKASSYRRRNREVGETRAAGKEVW